MTVVVGTAGRELSVAMKLPGENMMSGNFFRRILLLIMGIFLVTIVSGCFCTYKYDGFEAYLGQVSPCDGEDDFDNSKFCIIRIPRQGDGIFLPPIKSPPFSLLLYEKVRLDITPGLTKSVLLSKIKDLPYTARIANKQGFAGGDVQNREKDIILVSINENHVSENWTVSLLFYKEQLARWSLFMGEERYGKSLQIGKYKSDKFYPMPITGHQLKEIFGKPVEVEVKFNPK
ncbi:MAG: hypothetical protein PHQ27_02120 [Victivallales bacterium]|nr:hypothetical protein [Victivallales bacterium]